MKTIIKIIALVTFFMAAGQAFAGDSCYSPYKKSWVSHGDLGAKKCCWYGEWEDKSKCSYHHEPRGCYSDYDCGHGKVCKNPGRHGYCKKETHRNNCYHKDCWSPYLRKCVKNGDWGKYKKCSWGEWK